jgi:hypothetical protein
VLPGLTQQTRLTWTLRPWRLNNFHGRCRLWKSVKRRRRYPGIVTACPAVWERRLPATRPLGTKQWRLSPPRCTQQYSGKTRMRIIIGNSPQLLSWPKLFLSNRPKRLLTEDVPSVLKCRLITVSCRLLTKKGTLHPDWLSRSENLSTP